MILWRLMLIVVLGGAIWAVPNAVGGETRTPKIKGRVDGTSLWLAPHD